MTFWLIDFVLCILFGIEMNNAQLNISTWTASWADRTPSLFTSLILFTSLTLMHMGFNAHHPHRTKGRVSVSDKEAQARAEVSVTLSNTSAVKQSHLHPRRPQRERTCVYVEQIQTSCLLLEPFPLVPSYTMCQIHLTVHKSVAAPRFVYRSTSKNGNIMFRPQR